MPGSPKICFTKSESGLIDGETPGEFIGILVNDEAISSNTVSEYKWTKWAGEDGYGMEQIFFLGTSDKQPNKPEKPSGVSNSVWYSYDYEPHITNDTNYGDVQWNDHPRPTTDEKNCCWSCWRMLSVDSKKDWSAPQVYSLYAAQGRDAISVHVHNDNITVLVDDDNKAVIRMRNIANLIYMLVMNLRLVGLFHHL